MSRSSSPLPSSSSEYRQQSVGEAGNQKALIDKLLDSFLSKCREIPGSFEQPNDLTELNQERNWRQIVVITSSIPVSEYVIKINDDGQSFADAFLYRMESLFKLKMFDEILTLASTVLSYMESDSRLKSTSENLIIALRLTLVEVKVMTGGGDESICILTEIEKELSSKSQSQSQSKNSQSHQWLRVVKSLKVNHFIRQHQLRFAVAELSKIATMLEKSPDASLSSSEVIYSLITVFCLLARISVQMGAVSTADAYYKRATLLQSALTLPVSPAVSGKNSSGGGDTAAAQVRETLLLTKGLLCFTKSQYEEAMAVFTEVIDRHRNRYRNALSSEASLDPLTALASDSKLVRERVEKSHVTSVHTYLFATADLTQNTLALASNNISVCALFLKRIEYAVEVLESLIQENPFEYMTNNVVFNLCTLYDLSTTPEMGLTKKTVLHKVAAIYNVNDSTVPFHSYRFN